MGCVTTQELPVNLVEVIRFQYDAADDSGTSRCLHDYLNLAEEDVEISLHGRGLACLVDDEFGTVAAILEGSSLCYRPTGVCFGVSGEVAGKGRCLKAGVVWA